MKLSNLEQNAREKREEQMAQAAKLEAEEAEAEAKLTEEFRQKVIAWMVEVGDLDADELQETLSVVDRRYRRVMLSVPEHTGIVFQVSMNEGEIVGVRGDSRFEVLGFDGSNHYDYAANLGAALSWAAEKYQEGAEREAERAAWDAEREKRHKVREAEAIARGQDYLAWLDEYPILRPVLDILGMFLEDRERLENDLASAEEFYANAEARYEEKLNQAQCAADNYASERDNLQRDLWDEQEKARRAERRSKRGW